MAGTPVVLDAFGGLVATARPEDIPEGASPRCSDVDFITGRFTQRPGEQSVYTGTGVGVASVSILQGGYYTLAETVTVNFSGSGSGASGTAVTSTIMPPVGPHYKVVTGVTAIVPGSYTGPITVTFSGAGSGNDATGTVTTIPMPLPGPVAANFNGIVSAKLNQTDQVALILDANGNTWEEDVTNNPGSISESSVIPHATPGSYLKGLDADGIAYMAYSDLTQGVSQPMQFNGEWCDRITQVGPGQPPVFTPQQATSDTFDISQITQPPQKSDPADPGHFQALLWSAGPGLTAPGNVITVYYANAFTYPQDIDLSSAFASGNPVYVYVSATPISAANGTFQVTSIGNAIPPGGGYFRWYFTYQVPSNNYQFYGGPDDATGNYQRTLATMLVQEPVPGLAVGNQITISGNSQSSYNAQWTITQALNSGEMTITATSVTSGVATFDYALVTGAPPLTGELVTVTNTTNAGGNLNVTNAVIASSTAIGGTVNTSGTGVTWVSGDQFTSLSNGAPITIAGVTYTILTVNSATSITLTGSAGSQVGAIYGAGTVNTGSFTVTVPIATNYPSLAEAGQATTAGTIFAFDPGFTTLDMASPSPIYGTGTGGTFVFAAATEQLITPGVKQGSMFFITRNGAVTRPAPPVEVTIPTNCTGINCSQIPIGPPNVVARGFTFTESGQNGVKGASFYTYDVAETYIVNGVQFVSDALILNNNTDTAITLTFSDSVLLASDEIDVPGNNYFNLIELGNPAWMFQYATRMLYGLCQTKIQNLINMSFDGGYLPTGSSALPLPTGWTVNTSAVSPGTAPVTAFKITSDVVTFTSNNNFSVGLLIDISGLSTGTYLNGVPFAITARTSTTFSASFSHSDVALTSDSGTASTLTAAFGLVPSLDFGNALRITNVGNGNLNINTLLYQPAFQDYLNVPIIEPNTAYSVRIKARGINYMTAAVQVQFCTIAGSVITPTSAQVIIEFTESTYRIITEPIIPQSLFSIVPPNLILSIGVLGLSPGEGVEIDRIELFPTDAPVNTTTIWMSYAATGSPNYEAIDIETGTLGVGTENSQPAQGALEILEQLYIEKTASMCVTQDSPNYEPNDWRVRQTSDRAGAVGPNAFDEGEEFAVSASRNGVYFFDGGKPMPISRELQSTGFNANLWNTINWNAGNTIWLRNDFENRRLYIGVPMITPNFWLPKAPALTPGIPNVILMCNYTGCPTGEELATSPEVHVTMFGDLKALDMRRKWAPWQTPCPVAEFVPRGDGLSTPLFLCNGNASGKVYQFVPGSPTGQNTDDGSAINWLYTTYAFTKAKQGQTTPGLGTLRKVWYYLAATIEGIGQVAAKLYSNSLGALQRNTFTIPLPFALSYPQQNDQERVLEIGGQRVFVEFSAVGEGGYAEVGPVMLDGEMDKVSPHRGVAS